MEYLSKLKKTLLMKQEDLRTQFKKYDTDNSGYLDFDELKKIFQMVSRNMEDEYVQYVFDILDRQ